MKKYSKKIALILALSLALAIAIPALATETTITGTYTEPTIQVEVPTRVTAIINPLGLPQAIKSDAGNDVGEVLKSQIVTTEPIVGYNYGSVPLSVGASVIGTIPTTSTFKLSSEKPSSDSTAKSGLVYLEVKPGATDFDLGYKTAADTDTIGAFDGKKLVAALNGWEKAPYRESEKSQVIVKTIATKKTGMITIAAANKDTGVTKESCFLARLSSDLVKSPKDGWDPLVDSLTVKIAWIFEPV